MRRLLVFARSAPTVSVASKGADHGEGQSNCSVVRSVLVVPALVPTLAAFGAVTASPAGGVQRTPDAVVPSTVGRVRPGQSPGPSADTPGDPRHAVADPQGPKWGYHVDDVNLSLRNLIFDVNREEAAYH